MNVLDTFCICKTRTCDLCFVPTVGKWGEGKFDLVLFCFIIFIFCLRNIFSPWNVTDGNASWAGYFQKKSFPYEGLKTHSSLHALVVQVVYRESIFHFWTFDPRSCSFCDVKWPVLQLCVDDVGIWWLMFNFVFLPLKRSFQFNSRIVKTHFASIMTLNHWEMIQCWNAKLHFQMTFSLRFFF